MGQPPSPRRIKIETFQELIAALRFYAVGGHYDINGPGSVEEEGLGMPYRESAVGHDRGDLARAALAKLEEE